MGNCLSEDLPQTQNHDRAASISDHDGNNADIGDMKYNSNKSAGNRNKNGITYTDASHIYKNINKFLKKDHNLHKDNLRVKKLLLLGASSSGKSTLFNQLKCIHGDGFEEDEFVESKNVIRSNCVLGILTLLKKSQELHDENNEKHSDCFVQLTQDLIADIHYVLQYQEETFEEDATISKTELIALGTAIHGLWSLEAIQCTYNKRQYYSIIENMGFFLERSKEVFNHSYTVTQEHHLKCRIRTTGLIEANYTINEVRFHIFDVGGTRTERKKWIQLFEGVTCVIFVAALNHYCAVLFEDEYKNALLESLQLFEEITNSKWFKKTEMILFLNKNDLFRERIKDRIPLSVFFNTERYKPTQEEYYEEYSGPMYEPNHDDAALDLKSLDEAHMASADFIQSQYERRNHVPSKRIFVHITTATDQENIQKVFWDVQNIAINSNLKKGGLL